MSYTAAYGGHDRVPAERHLRRDHPLGLRKTYADPADEVDEGGTARKWTFGVAAGALLVAGTFAAGALGLNNGAAPLVTDGAPEHAPAAPGQNPGDIGGPAVAAPPDKNKDKRPDANRAPAQPTKPASAAPRAAAPAPAADQGYQNPGGSGGSAGGDTARPAPQPAPQPAPAPAPQPAPGPLEQVVTPVTDTVGDVVEPVTDTVGDILSPVTGVLSGGDQPALTMINPLGDLLGR